MVKIYINADQKSNYSNDDRNISNNDDDAKEYIEHAFQVQFMNYYYEASIALA